MKVFRGDAIYLQPGLMIFWPGHDGANKSSGVRAGVITDVRTSGDVAVDVQMSSDPRWPHRFSPKKHVILKRHLPKALVIMP